MRADDRGRLAHCRAKLADGVGREDLHAYLALRHATLSQRMQQRLRCPRQRKYRCSRYCELPTERLCQRHPPFTNLVVAQEVGARRRQRTADEKAQVDGLRSAAQRDRGRFGDVRRFCDFGQSAPRQQVRQPDEIDGVRRNEYVGQSERLVTCQCTMFTEDGNHCVDIGQHARQRHLRVEASLDACDNDHGKCKDRDAQRSWPARREFTQLQ